MVAASGETRSAFYGIRQRRSRAFRLPCDRWCGQDHISIQGLLGKGIGKRAAGAGACEEPKGTRGGRASYSILYPEKSCAYERREKTRVAPRKDGPPGRAVRGCPARLSLVRAGAGTRLRSGAPPPEPGGHRSAFRRSHAWPLTAAPSPSALVSGPRPAPAGSGSGACPGPTRGRPRARPPQAARGRARRAGPGPRGRRGR